MLMMVDNTIFKNVVMAFISIGFLYIFISTYLRKRKFYTRGIPARAYVLEMELIEKESDHDFASEKNAPDLIPKITFKTIDGKSITGSPLFYIRTKKKTISGAIIQVNYLPEHPEKFILTNPRSIYISFSFTVFFILVFGFVFSGNYFPIAMGYFSGALSILSLLDLIMRRRQAKKFPLV